MLLNKPNSLQDMTAPQASLLLRKGYLEFELFLQTAVYQSVGRKEFKVLETKMVKSLLATTNSPYCFDNILNLKTRTRSGMVAYTVPAHGMPRQEDQPWLGFE